MPAPALDQLAVLGSLSRIVGITSGATRHGEPLMSSDDRLDLEFAYTTYRDSCRDLYSPHYVCRRPLGHDGVHAAGFGAERLRWEPHFEPSRHRS